MSNNNWEQVRCPVCNRDILIEISKETKGKLRGKCGFCNHFSEYDIETKQFSNIEKLKK